MGFDPNQPRDQDGQWIDTPTVSKAAKDLKVGDFVELPDYRDPDSPEPTGHMWHKVLEVRRDSVGMQIVTEPEDGTGRERSTLGPDETFPVKRPGKKKTRSTTQEGRFNMPVTPDTLKEYRSVPFVDVDSAPDGGRFVGYAAVFDQEADLGSFTESVSRGAFRKSLAAGTNVPMLYDHQEHLPVLATTRSGTLKLSEDAKGLKVEADIANHFMGEAVREMVKRGDIDGMSWGFVAGPGNSRIEQRGGKPHRSLLNFKRLLDVSPTWDKTYADTEAAFRSLRMLEEIAADLDSEEQDLGGETPQIEDQAPDPASQQEEDPVEEQEEARSETDRSEDAAGVARRAAARRRHLIEMGLTLPPEFRQ